MGRLAKVMSGQCQPGLKTFKKGGKVLKNGMAVHDDEEQDKILIKKMLAKDKNKRGK